jgi:hypothetical protein
MPIEIRELVIRATVGPATSPAGPGAEALGGVGCSAAAEHGGRGDAGDRSAALSYDDDLVQTCVREVMRIIERKAER